MSRSRFFAYFVGPRAEIPEEVWDAVYCFRRGCSRKEPIPCKYIGGGCGDEYGWTVYLNANRAKARRLKLILDRHFGRTGQLLDITEWDENTPYPWERK